MTDRETGRSKGFGFVEMVSAEVAQAAIDALHGMSVDGRTIVVNLARPVKPVAALAVTTLAVSLPASVPMWATAMAATAAAGTDSCAGCPALPANRPWRPVFYVCAQRGWGIGPCASRNGFAIKIVAACAFSISAEALFKNSRRVNSQAGSASAAVRRSLPGLGPLGTAPAAALRARLGGTAATKR